MGAVVTFVRHGMSLTRVGAPEGESQDIWTFRTAFRNGNIRLTWWALPTAHCPGAAPLTCMLCVMKTDEMRNR